MLERGIMDAQDILEKEYIDNQKKDQELRKKSIEDGEAHLLNRHHIII